MLFAFDGANGANPEAGLAALNGKLYGTTFYGGAGGGGVVFEVTSSGSERTLHTFFGSGDGFNPYMSLLNVGGVLYGDTTSGGGFPCHMHYYGYGCGTIFSITPTGKERVLHRFAGGSDGSTPQVALVSFDGVLWGTSEFGGGKRCKGVGCGTVFSVTPAGKERIVYSFKAAPDGADPVASVVVFNGALYGTTFAGGTSHKGTVFTLTSSGAQRVLYSFRGGSDGANPWSALVPYHGKLYGTTLAGGGTGCRRNLGCGTIYAIDPNGAETVLHRFVGSDGANPIAGLTLVGKTFYGAGARGGTGCLGFYGCGVLFAIRPSGAYTVLHRFTGGPADGAMPQGDLLPMSGWLYGTTLSGGGTACYQSLGCGTIFRLRP